MSLKLPIFIAHSGYIPWGETFIRNGLDAVIIPPLVQCTIPPDTLARWAGGWHTYPRNWMRSGQNGRRARRKENYSENICAFSFDGIKLHFDSRLVFALVLKIYIWYFLRFLFLPLETQWTRPDPRYTSDIKYKRDFLFRKMYFYFDF